MTQRILKYVEEHPDLSTREIVDGTGVSRDVVSNVCYRYYVRGCLQRRVKGVYPETSLPIYAYSLTPAGLKIGRPRATTATRGKGMQTQTQAILDYIKDHPGSTTREISDALNYNQATVASLCRNQACSGVLKREISEKSSANGRSSYTYTLANPPAYLLKRTLEKAEVGPMARPEEDEMPEVPVLSVIDGVVKASSLDVAKFFGKEHFHVMRDIQELLNHASLGGQSNFGLTSYKDIQGKERPMYYMDKDGFTLLAMGFTGAKALQFKLAYIAEFNRLQGELKTLKAPNGQNAPLPPPAESSLDALMSDMAKRVVDHLFDEIQANLAGRRQEFMTRLIGLPNLAPEPPAAPAPVPVPAYNGNIIEIPPPLPRIGVVGLLPAQCNEITTEFGECFDISYWCDGPRNLLKSIAFRCEAVFLHTQHASYKTGNILRSAGARLIRVTGGLSSMKDALTDYYVKRSEQDVRSEKAP
jgi:Rha family phage regulatory protein